MNKDSISKKVYLDSNFLLSYWVKNHKYYDDSRRAFFDLIEKNFQLYLSPLVLDEVWYKTAKILRDMENEIRKPFKDYYNELKNLFEYLNNSPFINFIQFKDKITNGCREALENINRYNFKPHDAFHLAMMKDNGIFCIITKDSDFTNPENMKKLKENNFEVIQY